MASETENELRFNESMFRAHEANRWKFLEDTQTDTPGLFLGSPIPVLTCTTAYLVFVCIIGPLWMRNREPFQLKNTIRFYNLIMVLLALILFLKLRVAIETFGSMVDCSKTFHLSDQSSTKIYQMGNFIMMVRLSEYLDTIFFTLRKKQSQITFLHVFHHAFVPMYAYWILNTAPVRFNVYIILINSFIHVLMYFYYFLATFQQARGDSKQKLSLTMMLVNKLLMFKKYMTQLQILQFISLALYSVWAAVQKNQCNVPWTYIIANFLLAFGFLSLFVHFYVNIYKGQAARAVGTSKTKSK